MATALLGNTIPLGAKLVVLIGVLGPISGAHFNPAATLSFGLRRAIPVSDATLCVLAQIPGGMIGVLAARFMFDIPILEGATKLLTGAGQWTGEFEATFGLVGTILTFLKACPDAVPMAVGLYITAAYLFSASMPFANPALTIARGFSDTFGASSRRLSPPSSWCNQSQRPPPPGPLAGFRPMKPRAKGMPHERG